jgi:alpha-ketoglutarate-dependent 2,4-dichlorophenoxyacetate dioxygenase
MSISIFPVTASFAAEIGDIDLGQALADEDLGKIREAFATYSVLVFPAQGLTADQHLSFSRNFGSIEPTVDSMLTGKRLRLQEGISDIANLDADGNVWKDDSRMRLFQMMGNRLWHTDSSFKVPSGYASVLYARSIPPIGGNTEFADLRAAYGTLAASMKARVKSLIGEHSLIHSRKRIGFTTFGDAEMKAFAPVFRPLVRTIPESGRESLYIASHIGRILGLTDEESEALLSELTTHATQRQFVYSHRWRAGDLVMWDNRCTMHRGTQFDDTRWPRDMQRVTIGQDRCLRHDRDNARGCH